MLSFALPPFQRILCLGAHSDDIEIGCGATILTLARERPDVHVDWVVLTAAGTRANEARASAEAFLDGFASSTIFLKDFRDGYLPYTGREVKDCFEELKQVVQPDLILTHHGRDRHQDHRLVAELTWNTWRNHLILEYEIPKYDADLGTPQFFATVDEAAVQRKIDLLMKHFGTQHGKHWFDPQTFRGLMRVRGLECNAPSCYAEAFHARKLRIDFR